jgi:D-beta-D-heptose 7-phosphate kinase / D-beta-D-heptose 1-phosphate adenosyltransferase
MPYELVKRLARCKVALVGDLMLDTYLHGGVSRISPEAPVPVIKWKSDRVVAGGAGNVAANIASLGASVALVGVCGEDAERETLLGLLRSSGRIDLDGVVTDASRRTVKKTRVIGHAQQMLRIDHEDDRPIDEDVARRLITKAIEAIDKGDIVVLSDYAKGVLNDPVIAACIARARETGKRLIVDPKRADLSAYSGASILTPNRAELTMATGMPCETDEEAEAAAQRVRAATGAEVLLTRSEMGMSFFPARGEAIHLPTTAKSVFDVSGAGDTVVALIAVGLAAGLPMIEAMKIANHAAGIVVSRFGTATLTSEELAASLAASHMTEVRDGRLLDTQTAIKLRKLWEAQGYSVGLTNGCFDLLHPGHVSLIKQASRVCDRLIVALNTDASVKRLKGLRRPVQNEVARAEVIGALKGVDAVVLFDEDTPQRIIEQLQPDVLVKGADYQEGQIVGADVVRARGGKIVRADLIEGQSTTRLLQSAPP